MDLGLGGASVVVAGGTSGMGWAAAECFAADGARVAVLARSADDLAAAEKELERRGAADALGVRADLTDAASVDAALALVGKRWGHLNAVVNAAGPLSTPLKPFAEYSDDEWLEVFSGITLGPVRTVSAPRCPSCRPPPGRGSSTSRPCRRSTNRCRSWRTPQRKPR